MYPLIDGRTRKRLEYESARGGHALPHVLLQHRRHARRHRQHREYVTLSRAHLTDGLFRAATQRTPETNGSLTPSGALALAPVDIARTRADANQRQAITS